jgi:hypothetical protein
MIVTAALAIAVIAEGAYIVRTRTQLATLSERLEALGAAADEGRAGPPARLPRFQDADFDVEPDPALRPAGPGVRPPPPKFLPGTPAPAASDDPLPLPAAIASPVAREQLRNFVVAQLERERQEARLRQEERFTQRNRERQERVVKELGLTPAERDKYFEITAQADAARAGLRDRIEAGQLDRANARQEMMALRSENEKQLRTLLGDARMEKLDGLRRELGGPPEGRWGRFGAGDGPGGDRGARVPVDPFVGSSPAATTRSPVNPFGATGSQRQ